MEHKRIIIDNSRHQTQEFEIDEYEDHCEIATLLSRDLEQVEIPAVINGKPVTAIGDDCFFCCRDMRSVFLPECVTRIGVRAFALCEKLTAIELPDSISEIGAFAFRDCRSLKRIVMPSGLKHLETGTFSYCYLRDDVEIILKEGLESIGRKVFSSGGLSLFFSLKLPQSVKTIADGAFVPGMNIITDLTYDEKWFEI